jgi:PAS domain S-box-containing protein
VADLKWYIENYGAASLAITTLIGLILKFRKCLKDVIRTIILSNNFHAIFGDTPAGSIKILHETIQKSNDILEVRMRISERYLKIGLYVCDLQGKAVWLNDVICEMFGLDSRCMLGFGWLEAIHPKDRERVNEEWLYAIHHEIAYNSSYTICNHRTNTSMNVKTTAIAVMDDHDHIVCYVGYLEVKSMKPLDCEFNDHNH